MKTAKKFAVLTSVAGVGLFISAGAIFLLSGGIDYTTPPAGHFVSPLSTGITWGPVRNIKAFFPAQANLQWLGSVAGYTDSVAGSGSTATHPGASFVQSGSTDCRGCHQDNLDAGIFATGLVNKPKGITGKDPYKDLKIQAAFDSSYLYIKVNWQTQFSRPGISHFAWQYRSGTWYRNSKDKTSAKNTVAQLAQYEFFSCEDRLGIQLAPKTLGDNIKAFGNAGMSFTQAGCFVACHSSMRDMPKAPTSAQVQADPWLGTGGLNQTDIRHYLLHTRGVNAYADADSAGNWQTTVSGYNSTQQQADFNAGKFIDLIQFRGARSAPVYSNSNDAIMEYRHSGEANTNKGDNHWFDQDPNVAQPANVNDIWYDVTDHEWKDASAGNAIVNVSGYRWMYDSTITGFYAMPDNAVNYTTGGFEYDWTIDFPLITRGPGRNAVPFNVNKIKPDERLPRPVLRKGTGIRAAASAFSAWDSTTKEWTVTVRRPLNKTAKCDHGSYGTYCSDHDIRLADLQSSGQGITIGFAVFDDNVEVRYHHVTFPYHLQASSSADIVAYDNTATGIEWLDAPNTLSLEQNEPNPFTGITQIKYTLQKGEKVKLNVYDINGRLVKTLADGYKTAGSHTVTWNAGDLNKGVYFYTLQAGNIREAKRAVLVK